MAHLHLVKPLITGPEYGDGDDEGGENLECPDCENDQFNLVEIDEEEIIAVCAECGAEIDISSVED
jgi:NMD protein affecting ribosome stability and mRNA decay